MMFRLAVLILATLMTGCASLPSPQVTTVGQAQMAWVKRGAEGPTVVFQSGLGDGMSPWAPVIDRLPPAVAAFAYDRPGYGASRSQRTAVRDPCEVATELRDTLRAAQVPPPYLLVGHSLGGQYQVAFARLFPDEVAGVLLLDPTHPEHWATMQREAPGAAAAVSALRAAAFSAPMRAEFDGQGRCLDATPAYRGEWPTRLLARTRYEMLEGPAFRQMVERLHQDWLRHLPGSTTRAVDGASHYIHRDQPDVVVAELMAMRTAVRR